MSVEEVRMSAISDYQCMAASYSVYFGISFM